MRSHNAVGQLYMFVRPQGAANANLAAHNGKVVFMIVGDFMARLILLHDSSTLSLLEIK